MLSSTYFTSSALILKFTAALLDRFFTVSLFAVSFLFLYKVLKVCCNSNVLENGPGPMVIIKYGRSTQINRSARDDKNFSCSITVAASGIIFSFFDDFFSLPLEACL